MPANLPLFQPTDLTEPGAYWYFDQMGGEAQVVVVGDVDVPRADWEVQFPGRGDVDALQDLSGFFMGPIPRPARPAST